MVTLDWSYPVDVTRRSDSPRSRCIIRKQGQRSALIKVHLRHRDARISRLSRQRKRDGIARRDGIFRAASRRLVPGYFDILRNTEIAIISSWHLTYNLMSFSTAMVKVKLLRRTFAFLGNKITLYITCPTHLCCWESNHDYRATNKRIHTWMQYYVCLKRTKWGTILWDKKY